MIRPVSFIDIAIERWDPLIFFCEMCMDLCPGGQIRDSLMDKLDLPFTNYFEFPFCWCLINIA
jgi:hypothetical protein